MGYKMNGNPFTTGGVQGTSSHTSALKMVAEQKAASALKAKEGFSDAESSSSNGKYTKASKKDPNLASYIAERKKHKKGSNEYNAAQNKINKAYGSSTRHGYTTSTEDSQGVSTEERPGTGTTVVTKKRDAKTNYPTKQTREFTGEKGEKGRTVIKSDAEGNTKKIKSNKKNYSNTENTSYDEKATEKFYTRGEEKGTTKKKRSKTKLDLDNDGKVDRTTRKRSKTNRDGETTQKAVTRGGGRRVVRKTDKEGNETEVKSRRTIKGFLTGKGKKEDYKRYRKEKDE